MKAAAIIAALLLTMAAASCAAGFAVGQRIAAAYKLKAFSVEEVQARCTKVHGVFFERDGTYGCSFGGGLVQCSVGSRCVGYPKRDELPQNYWYGDRW